MTGFRQQRWRRRIPAVRREKNFDETWDHKDPGRFAAYANANFYQSKTSSCGWFQICWQDWKYLGGENAPDIGPYDGWHLEIMGKPATGRKDPYATSYAVCANVPYREDHCTVAPKVTLTYNYS